MSLSQTFFPTSCKEDKTDLKKILRFYRPFLKKYRRNLIFLMALSLTWSVSETVAPYCIKLIIDKLSYQDGLPQDILRALIWMGALYMGLVILMESSLRLCHFIWIKTLPELKAKIRDKSLHSFQQQPFGFFNDTPVGKAMTHYRHLSHCFEQLLSSFIYSIFPTVISSLAALILMYPNSPIFTFLFALWYFGMNGVTYIFAKRSFKAATQQAEAETKILSHVGDLFRNDIVCRTVSWALCPDPSLTYSLQQREITQAKKLEWLSFKTDLLRGGLSLAMLLFMMIFLIGGWKKEVITLGDFAFIASMCLYARRSAWVASIQLLESFKTLGTLSQSLASLNLSVPKAQTHRTFSRNLKGNIIVQNLCFGYVPSKKILHNISFHINAGEKVALTGKSGIGKTSLVHLLLGFHQPTSGKILFDGIDQAALGNKNLRSNISYVPQMMTLFHRTIRENILYGTGHTSEKELFEAARQARCHDFIQELPKGYDTLIGEDGIKLSGGQRQRVFLARAFLKNAPILILDESFSALDHENEYQILEALLSQNVRKTLILISHRTCSVEKMERIIEIK